MKLVKICVGTLLAVTACGNDQSNGLGLQASQVRAVMPPNAPVACAQATVPPPVVAPQVLNMWPPNHKFHTFSPADCVGDVVSCDPTVHAMFLWASSDEPVDDLGDGHFAPDIIFDDCDQVELRSERQGPKNGRVYKLGVRVTDGKGVSTDSVCTVIVDHDQRGVVGADSGESYRITADGTGTLPLCNGVVPPSAPADAGNPPPPPPATPADAGTPTPADAGVPSGDPYLGSFG